MKNWWYAYLAVIFVIVFAASGCRADENGAIAVGTQIVTDDIEPTATIVPTETPLPTEMPQPSLVVLYTPGNFDDQATAAWQER